MKTTEYIPIFRSVRLKSMVVISTRTAAKQIEERARITLQKIFSLDFCAAAKIHRIMLIG